MSILSTDYTETTYRESILYARRPLYPVYRVKKCRRYFSGDAITDGSPSIGTDGE